jgi:hypothetical protein
MVILTISDECLNAKETDMRITKADASLLSLPLAVAVLLSVLFLLAPGAGALQLSASGPASTETKKFQPAAPIGPGNVIVHPQFGGAILGFGIDPAGSEGLLSEYTDLRNGGVMTATETFDLKTGKIVKVVSRQTGKVAAFKTWGVFGNHVGLSQKTVNNTVDYLTLRPLSANKFTGVWTPPFLEGYLLSSLSSYEEGAKVAVMTYENGGNLQLSLFSSNLAKNSFGPQVAITDGTFCICNSPVMAYDIKTNEAVLASSNSTFSTIATANLTTGVVTEFPGLGFGFVAGISVDPETGIAATTSISDAGVEFYDLATQTEIEVTLPCSLGEEQFSGNSVQIDPVNQVFLVQQIFNACDKGARLYVYDEKGTVLETLTGFQILPLSPTPIALHPSDRSGFMFQTRLATTLQSFTY